MVCDFIRPGARFNDLPHSMRARKPLHHRYRAVDMRSYNRLLQTYTYLSTVLAWSNTNEHLSSPSIFSGVRVTRSLVLCVCFVDLCLSFCPISFHIVFSVLLRFTKSDHPFGIFNLFLCKYHLGLLPRQSKVQLPAPHPLQNQKLYICQGSLRYNRR